MISRLKAGESYCDVFGEERRRRGYPARSVFEWRTPLLLSAPARVPDLESRGVLAALGFLPILADFRTTGREPLWVRGNDIVQAEAVRPVITAGGLVMGKVWAGLLIGLSVCMFAQERPGVAIALGSLALSLRELAAPHCAACAVAALAQRRWWEVYGWRMPASAWRTTRHTSSTSGHINCPRASPIAFAGGAWGI